MYWDIVGSVKCPEKHYNYSRKWFFWMLKPIKKGFLGYWVLFCFVSLFWYGYNHTNKPQNYTISASKQILAASLDFCFLFFVGRGAGMRVLLKLKTVVRRLLCHAISFICVMQPLEAYVFKRCIVSWVLNKILHLNTVMDQPGKVIIHTSANLLTV